MATIDVAMESSVQAVKTVADNIYAKVDTEIATINTTVNNIYGKVDTELQTVDDNVDTIKTYVDSIFRNTDIKTSSSKTGTLSQKDTYIIELLENSNYGLSALKTALSGGSSVIKSVQRGTASITLKQNTSEGATTVSISSVNTSKAVVLYGGCTVGETAYLELSSSTSVAVKVRRETWSNEQIAVIPYQVIEFV